MNQATAIGGEAYIFQGGAGLWLNANIDLSDSELLNQYGAYWPRGGVGTVAALYNSNPKDLQNNALDAFYAALLAKLALVVDERISRHRIQFLMSPPPNEAEIVNTQGVQRSTSKGMFFRSSVNRMGDLKGRLTAELSALRSELDTRPSVVETWPTAPATQPSTSALAATQASEPQDRSGLGGEPTAGLVDTTSLG